MTPAEFTAGIDRLKNVYGEKAYANERVKVIFRAVQDMSGAWWARAVEQLIGTHRNPPMMPEIGELLSLERERNWSTEKRQHSQDAHGWGREYYGPEEKRVIFDTIQKRIAGQVPDESWDAFLKMLGTGRGAA